MCQDEVRRPICRTSSVRGWPGSYRLSAISTLTESVLTSLSPVQPPVRVPVCQQESLGRHCVRALCVIILCVY